MRPPRTASALGTCTTGVAPRRSGFSGASSPAGSGAPSATLPPSASWRRCDDPGGSMISGTSLPDIFELLPHRFPFLLVDRITGIDPGRRAEGIKRVTGNEWFLGEATLDVAPP